LTETAERCLGIDLGEKRIGLSLSDSMGWTAGPLPALLRSGWKKDREALRSLLQAHQVQRVVVGLPIRMDGTEGDRARQARDFAQRLQQSCRIPVETWDERLTSVQAERLLLEADLSRQKRRAVIDSLAACIILQAYLDYRNRPGEPQ
jgi:putative pre-16S rRNA nuclease